MLSSWGGLGGQSAGFGLGALYWLLGCSAGGRDALTRQDDERRDDHGEENAWELAHGCSFRCFFAAVGAAYRALIRLPVAYLPQQTAGKVAVSSLSS
jgi:hypothetical protein